MNARLLLPAGLIMLASLTASAQTGGPYDLSWSRIAGGGGSSSGGNYTLVGTIGQHDAGSMAGGNYTLEGGFLSGLVLIQTVGAPTISITKSGANAIISWSVTGSDGFVLQESGNLASPLNWGGSPAVLTTNGATISVTVPATGLKFFRLKKP